MEQKTPIAPSRSNQTTSQGPKLSSAEKSHVPAGPAIPEAATVTTAAKPAAILILALAVAVVVAVIVGIVLYARS